MRKGKIINRAELSELYATTTQTAATWVKRGCPFVQMGNKGKEWLFDTAEVAAWREEQAALSAIGDTDRMDIDEAKRRKIAAEAAMAELDLSVRKGELVEISEIEKAVGDNYASARAKLLNVTARLVGELSDDQRDLVDNEIRAALLELSDYDET